MDTPAPDPSPQERRALAWVAAIACAALIYLVAPVALGMLLGTLLAFLAQPMFVRLQRRLGRATSAAVTVVLVNLCVIGFLAGTGWLLAAKGTTHTKELIASLGPEAPGGGALNRLSSYAVRVGLSPDELPTRVRSAAEGAGTWVATGAQTVLQATASTLLTFFFMVLAMYFVLSRAASINAFAMRAVPLRPVWTAQLFNEFRRVGKTILLGTFATGVIQGVLATIGYWIAGVDDPIFYGVATAFASLVPAVGTLVIWIPLGIASFATGHPFAGALVLAWGSLVIVFVSDYVLRPRLIGGESQLPSLFTFAALFGGVEVFGLKGLIVGPLLMSVCIALLRLYVAEGLPRAPEKET